MGGIGSGRDSYADTPTVEECRSIDANDLKELTEQPNGEGVIWWGDRDDPDARVAVITEGDADLEDETRPAQIRLRYTVTRCRTDESREYNYPIPLEYTECNFGGYRPWFRCPKCRDRRRKLYFPPGRERLLCRECYDLGYRSSRTSGDELKQAELRYKRAFEKADKENRRPHPNGNRGPFFPDRPKGMHHDTFEELCKAVDEAREGWHNTMERRMRELLGRYSDEVDMAENVLLESP